MKRYYSLGTREQSIEAIKATGEYVVDHAENILGEYPSGLVKLTISVVFDGESAVCIDTKRTHIVTGRAD